MNKKNNKEINTKELIIHPNNINIEERLWEAFNDCETEASAYWIIKLCQQKNGWFDFTHEEINNLYEKAEYKEFLFNRLITDGYIIKYKNTYKITSTFVFKCAKTNYKEIEN